MINRLKQCVPRSWKRMLKKGGRNLIESPQYYRERPVKMAQSPETVIFVCKGNICRSAFAEFYLKKVLTKGHFLVESCGIEVDQGNFSPPEAIQVAKRYGVDMTEHRSKGMSRCDIEGESLILPMEYPQYRALLERFPEKRDHIRLLREFTPGYARLFCNIYDPFGQNEQAFALCFQQVAMAVDGLVKTVLT